MQWQIVNVFLVFAFQVPRTIAQDVCTKFNVGGPCLMLVPTNGNTNRQHQVSPAKAYCSMACQQGGSRLFSSFCECAKAPLETTTPPLTTTTQRPITCYYSSQRPARLNSISRRMYSSTPVTTECDYPGVVGLFREDKGQMQYLCMASLLQEDVLLINEKNCLMWVQRYTVYALVDSYTTSNVTTAISLNSATLTKLDPTGSLTSLYTVKLNSRLTFDSGCIQPICVPNINIPASDIDLDDCRLVGYGDTTDKPLSSSPQLNEIKVRVTPASVTKSNLAITRVDKLAGMTCMSDDSAPLICSHKYTEEWVTIGITISIGFPCSTPSGVRKPAVASLFQEVPTKEYFNAIQQFKYADPNVFTAYMNSSASQ